MGPVGKVRRARRPLPRQDHDKVGKSWAAKPDYFFAEGARARRLGESPYLFFEDISDRGGGDNLPAS